MVSSLPGCSLIFFRCDLSPYFSAPVKHTDRVKTLLVRPPSSKNYNFVGDRIIVDGAVGPVGRFLTGGVDFLPTSFGGVVSPEVVHVIRI